MKPRWAEACVILGILAFVCAVGLLRPEQDPSKEPNQPHEITIQADGLQLVTTSVSRVT
jgi:hypothetical protein